MEAEGSAIGVCGTLSVRVDGAAVEREFPGRQGRLAFALLALRHPEPVTRDELVQALWPDDPTPAARSALSPLLSKLKRALGPGVLDGRDPLRLELPPGVRTDLARAADHVGEAETAIAAGRAEEASELARAALAVLARPLCEGLEAPFLETARREALELRLRALETVVRAHLRSDVVPGGHARAVQLAQELVAAAPYRETGHRLLMEVLAREGDVAGAAAAYDRLVTCLEEELGAEPGPETRALHARLLESPPPARPAVPAALSRADAQAFVGRETILDTLSQSWRAAVGGKGRVVALAGEPGLGKTRVAARFACECHGDGAIVLLGRCEEEGGGVLDPVAELLAPLLDGTGARAAALGPLASELERLRPGAAAASNGSGSVTAGGLPLAGSLEADRFRLFTAVEELLGAVAREAPVLILLDDAHWADRATLALLRHVARGLAGARVLVLVTWRDVDAPAGHPLREVLGDLRREGLATLEHLAGLEADELADLAAAVGVAAHPDALAGLARRTAGNPLFAAELLRALAETRQLADSATAVLDLPAPEGVRALVSRRLAARPREVAQVLTAAAVLGSGIDVRVLEAMDDLHDISVMDALEGALEARMAIELPEHPGRFEFAHALVRDALYDALSAARRARLHMQAAAALADLPRTRPAELARHLQRAGDLADPAQVVAALRATGDAARRNVGYEEAAEAFATASGHAERAGLPPAERWDLLLREAEARHCLGEAEAARRAAGHAADLARAAGDSVALARAGLAMRGPYVDSGVVDMAIIDLLEEGLASLPQHEQALRAIVEARLAEALFWAGAQDRVSELSAHALRAATAAGDPLALTAAFEARHDSLRHPDGLEERLELAREFTSRARELGDRALAAQAHQLLAVDLLEAGDRDAAEREFAVVARLAVELRQPLFERYAGMWDVMRAQLDGRLDDAERLAHETMRVAMRTGSRDAAQGFGAQLWCVLRYRGGVESLRGTVEAILHEFPSMAVWRAGLALLCAESGDPGTAAEHLALLAENDFSELPRDAFWLCATTMAADAYVALEAPDPVGMTALRAVLEPHAHRVVLARGAACLGPAARSLGPLVARLGDVDGGIAHLEGALACSRALRSPLLEAHSLLELAAVLRAAGRGCQDQATAGRTLAQRLGLHRLLERLG